MGEHRFTLPRRFRPRISATVAPDVEAALRERATRRGGAVSHVVDDLLRQALGLPPAPLDAVIP